MTILHIAHVGMDRLSGVNVAVPAIVHAQEALARVGILNLTNAPVPEVRENLRYRKGMELASLPEPFCSPDLIVFHELYRPAYLNLSAQARKQGIPYVVVPHGCMTDSAQRIKAYKKIPANFLLFGRVIRGAESIQCLSERELEQTHFDVPKFIGTNGIEPGPVKSSFSREGMVFTYIGRLDYHIKGLDLLMEALGRERDFLIANRCRVNLYGPDSDGSRERLTRQCRELGLEELLSVREPVTGDEKRAVLMGTDCYIQTSRSEGMSMGILEALGMGVPCLVTEGTAMADWMRHQGAGWGCRTDAEAIAAAIHQAVTERESLAERSEKARSLVEERFTWNRVAADVLNQYQTIISGKKPE